MFEIDGILLEPCLLHPCFHVAGIRLPRTRIIITIIVTIIITTIITTIIMTID